MDPISVIGLIGSVFGIVDVIGKSVASLIDLQSRYQVVDLKVRLMISNLSMIKATLGCIADVINKGPVLSGNSQFLEMLSTSLEGCEVMIAAIDNRLSTLQRNGNGGLATSSKMSMLWDESTMNDYLNILNHQINALNLLLTFLNCRSTFEQDNILRDTSSLHVFNQIKDDTSSLRCLQDLGTLNTSTRNSVIPDPDGINVIFGFDPEVFNSRVYMNATRSNMIFSIQTGAHKEPNSAASSQASTASPLLRINRTFSLRSFRYQDNESVSSVQSLGTREKRGLPTSTERDTDPKDFPIHPWQDLDIQASYSSRRRLRDSIRSTFSENTSIFRFAQRRNVSVSSAQLSLTPRQAPCDATKVLLLGSGGSGKTTITKSLEAAFGYYNTAARQEYRYRVYNNAIKSIETLLLNYKDAPPYSIPRMEDEDKFLENESNFLRASCDRGLGTSSLPQELASAMSYLWNNPRIRAIFAQPKRRFYLLDSAKYFLDSINRMSQKDYIPSVQDILHSYEKSNGISVSHFEVNNKSYNFYDVGGARSQRKKWIHEIADVDVLIFTVDASCFRDILQEDEDTNAMREQFMLWEHLSNSHWFSKSHIIVLFTKVDKLNAVPAKWPPALYDAGDSFMDVFKEQPTTTDDILRGLADYLSSMIDDPQSKERPTRWLTFWHASITNSSTELAEVTLSALEHIETDNLK